MSFAPIRPGQPPRRRSRLITPHRPREACNRQAGQWAGAGELVARCGAARRAREDVLMAGLKDRLRADLTAAMKARDDVRTRTLRMVLTSVANEEVAGKAARDLSDDEVLRVL